MTNNTSNNTTANLQNITTSGNGNYNILTSSSNSGFTIYNSATSSPPSGWLTINSNGISTWDDSRMSHVATETAIFPTEVDISNSYYNFHYLIWKALYPDQKHIFITVNDMGMQKYNTSNQLSFCDMSTRDSFIEWWEPYKEKFNGNIANKSVPEPRQNKSLISCKSNITHYDNSYDSELFHRWAWIMGNCNHEVFGLDGFWFFESEQDKCLYSLKWG